MKKIKLVAIRLSILVVALAAMASGGGIFLTDLYRDNALIKAVWLGNDLVTLFLVIPILIWVLYKIDSSSFRVQLIWMGILWYMIYNYIFYMYGAAFNYFFLLYVFIFTISVYSLILALMDFDRQAFAKSIGPKIPTKWIAGFMLFFALIIGGIWVTQSLQFVFTGEVPIGVTQTDHPTGVVFATDLSLLVSSLMVGGFLLWKKEVWGYIVGVIALTKCLLYPFALVIGGVMAFNKTGTWDSLIPLYVVLWVGASLAYFNLLKGIGNERGFENITS